MGGDAHRRAVHHSAVVHYDNVGVRQVFKLYLYTAIAPVPLSSLRESRARMSAGALSRVIVPCALRVQSSCLSALSFRCLRLPRPWSIPMRLRSRWCGAISGNWYSICSSLSVRSRWQTVSCVNDGLVREEADETCIYI